MKTAILPDSGLTWRFRKKNVFVRFAKNTGFFSRKKFKKWKNSLKNRPVPRFSPISSPLSNFQKQSKRVSKKRTPRKFSLFRIYHSPPPRKLSNLGNVWSNLTHSFGLIAHFLVFDDDKILKFHERLHPTFCNKSQIWGRGIFDLRILDNFLFNFSFLWPAPYPIFIPQFMVCMLKAKGIDFNFSEYRIRNMRLQTVRNGEKLSVSQVPMQSG